MLKWQVRLTFRIQTKINIMLTLPNLLSFLRIPLAFIFLQQNPAYRAAAIILALISDGLDGFVARRNNQQSRLGSILDPFSDKFFVFFALTVLVSENRLSWQDGCVLFCRDLSVICYGFYLCCKGQLLNYRFRSIWCGKITTVLQLSVLLALTMFVNFKIPSYAFGVFIVLGVLAFFELYQTDNKLRAKS